MRKHLISIKKHIIALLLISIISSNVLEVMASPLADKGKDGTTNQTSDNKASNDKKPRATVSSFVILVF